MPGGGYDYIYRVGSALVHFPVPPKGFNPLSATAAKLQEYGFQPRPSGGTALAQWTNMMAHYRQTPIPSVVLVQSQRDHLVKKGHIAFGTENSANWAGWIADSTTQEFVATQMDYTQPAAQATSCAGAVQSVWTGLGGVNSTSLVQDGTALPGTIPGASGYSAWYEYMNGTSNVGPKVMGNLVVNPGDSIHLYTAYSTSNGEINFYIADNTTGTSQAALVTGVGTAYYDGSSTEYITERSVCGNGCFYPLEQFTAFSSSTDQAETTSGSWIPISSAPYPLQVSMFAQVTGDLLAAPSGLNSSGDGFSTTWYACS